MKSIEKKLRQIMSDLNLVHDLQQISFEANLFSLGALDSLILVQFVLAIEDEFKISIPNTDINYENFKSFKTQSEYLSPLIEGKNR